jgi:DNA-binding transcriptional regulator YiaG
MTNHPNRSRKASPAKNPKPMDIKKARIKAGLSQTAAAELLYTSVGTWQQWESEEGTDAHRRMHPAFWELFQIKAKALE